MIRLIWAQIIIYLLKETRYFAPLRTKIKILSVIKPLFVDIALTAVLASLPLSDPQVDPA